MLNADLMLYITLVSFVPFVAFKELKKIRFPVRTGTAHPREYGAT